jgi:hypothetical protein
MRFRWSGATACDLETAAARLNEYFGAVGYRTLPSELRWARGSLWKALLTMSPRQLPIIVEAKVQPWGAQTLVDVTFDFPRSVRTLSEQDADLIVAELRGLNEYLQHGVADFEGDASAGACRPAHGAPRAAQHAGADCAPLAAAGVAVWADAPAPAAGVAAGRAGRRVAGELSVLATDAEAVGTLPHHDAQPMDDSADFGGHGLRALLGSQQLGDCAAAGRA